MRKVSIFMLLLLSALIAWGGEDETFDLNKAKLTIDSLKQFQNEIVQQAQNVDNTRLKEESKKLTSEDKTNADSYLTKTFNSIDSVLNAYDNYKENPELDQEAQELISSFIKAYKKAILSQDQKKIEIASRSFLIVAEQYYSQFPDFNRKAQDYIKNHRKKAATPQVFNYNEEVQQVETNDSSPTKWDIIAMCIGILGIVTGGYALFWISIGYSRIRKRQNDQEDAIKEMGDRLLKQINDFKTSSYRGPSEYSYPPSTHSAYQPKHSGRNRDSHITKSSSYLVEEPLKYHPTAVTTSQPEERRTQPEPLSQPTKSYLFATVKTGLLIPEFSKVSSENTGDKVYMLILPSPEADVAEFTIVPDMEAAFLKSVISNKETYLPASFCEKSISSNPTKIDVVSQGMAKKVDGKWQVTDRMNIRLV